MNTLKTTLVHIAVLAAVLFMAPLCHGQQIAHTSTFEGTKAFWNPAATAITPAMQTDVWFRQQWLGFGSTAPRTGYVGFQMPFTDLSMGAGGMVHFDQTGPVSKAGLQLNYSYQLKGILRENSQLSLGISGGFQQYSFNKDNVIFNDQNDVLLQANSTSALYPTIGAGLYYMSSTDAYYENSFYFGLSYNQLYSTDVLINDFNQQRERHVIFNIGSKIYGDDSFIEPSLTVNVTTPEIINFIAAAKYEMRDRFWVGLGYSSVSELVLQGGYVIDRIASRYDQLRIGIIGNIGINDSVSNFGPGTELYISYRFDVD